MTDDNQIIPTIRRLLPQLRDLGATSVSLFGSAARGELRPDSDVDVLIEFERRDAPGYFEALFLLEDELGRSVDLVIPETLHQQIRAQVVSEAVRVA